MKINFSRVLSLTLLLVAPFGAQASTGEPVRVATLVPYVGQALRNVPDRAVVVASVRERMTESPAAPALDLGSPHSPNLEQLAASRAQVVVADEMMHAALKDRLARTGAEVILVRSDSVDATFDGIVAVGTRVGAESEMKQAVGDARDGIRKQALDKPVSTLSLFGTPGSFFVITSRTWLGDLLQELKFADAAPGAKGQERIPGYVQMSDEVLAGVHPELVLLVSHGDPMAIRAALEKKLEGGPWSGLDARSNLGLHVLDGHLFSSNPGLALPEAAQRLRRLAQAEPAPAQAQ